MNNKKLFDTGDSKIISNSWRKSLNSFLGGNGDENNPMSNYDDDYIALQDPIEFSEEKTLLVANLQDCETMVASPIIAAATATPVTVVNCKPIFMEEINDERDVLQLSTASLRDEEIPSSVVGMCELLKIILFLYIYIYSIANLNSSSYFIYMLDFS